MKIGFDYPIFTLQHTGGASRYFVRLVEQLLSLGEEVEVYAPLLINHCVTQLPRAVVRGWPVPFLPQKTARLLDVVNRCLTPLMAGNRRYDLVHETYYTTTPVMTNASARVTTIHDMIPERFPHFFSSCSRIWQRKQAAIQRADHIICVSQQTKMDLCDVYAVEPARITVIYLGVDTQWAAGASTAVQERPFLLYVGRRGRYKNFRGLLEAVARSRALRRELAVIAFGGEGLRPRKGNSSGGWGCRSSKSSRCLAMMPCWLGTTGRRRRWSIHRCMRVSDCHLWRPCRTIARSW